MSQQKYMPIIILIITALACIGLYMASTISQPTDNFPLKITSLQYTVIPQGNLSGTRANFEAPTIYFTYSRGAYTGSVIFMGDGANLTNIVKASKNSITGIQEKYIYTSLAYYKAPESDTVPSNINLAQILGTYSITSTGSSTYVYLFRHEANPRNGTEEYSFTLTIPGEDYIVHGSAITMIFTNPQKHQQLVITVWGSFAPIQNVPSVLTATKELYLLNYTSISVTSGIDQKYVTHATLTLPYKLYYFSAYMNTTTTFITVTTLSTITYTVEGSTTVKITKYRMTTLSSIQPNILQGIVNVPQTYMNITDGSKTIMLTGTWFEVIEPSFTWTTNIPSNSVHISPCIITSLFTMPNTSSITLVKYANELFIVWANSPNVSMLAYHSGTYTLYAFNVNNTLPLSAIAFIRVYSASTTTLEL